MPRIGVVLAGGLSSRMGRDKALLPWRGRPLIEHQIAVLQAAGVDSVQVSGARPDYHGIADPIAQLGPVGGIAGIAAACGNAQLLIIPVDMPRLQPALLQRLLAAGASARSAYFIDHVLPMTLRLDAACRDVLAKLQAIDHPRDRSLRALQARVGATVIALDEEEETQLIDCNTEQTWQEACE
ncbi:molybdenum cofactor guanylyltransferase [Dyella mobilis]|uniref:Molybdenum cofactor guanylyltransferase n=1 Tax=Dyella mobilis TaxID=1849582 RepID=A0ABS2KKH4_9GAMM|nr:molybdenum cofactor guanylyltransferase [Dyella mobilis]MBM7131664.1 molybdenum cofactor guanylyltransferase [Dyella mobilis]GLQ96361.1 molybdenum cofactor guanylyltransferase [Dyella mobilis]